MKPFVDTDFAAMSARYHKAVPRPVLPFFNLWLLHATPLTRETSYKQKGVPRESLRKREWKPTRPWYSAHCPLRRRLTLSLPVGTSAASLQSHLPEADAHLGTCQHRQALAAKFVPGCRICQHLAGHCRLIGYTADGKGKPDQGAHAATRQRIRSASIRRRRSRLRGVRADAL